MSPVWSPGGTPVTADSTDLLSCLRFLSASVYSLTACVVRAGAQRGQRSRSQSPKVTYLQVLRLQGELGGFLSELPGEAAIVGLQFNSLLFKPVQLALQDLP